jgi:hypothetical protein
MEKRRGTHRVLVATHEKKRSLGRPRGGYMGGNIKMELQQTGLVGEGGHRLD